MSIEEGKVKEEPVEDSLEYESDLSYHVPPVGSEVMTLVLIKEEDLANAPIVTQVPFHPIHIATVSTSWTKTVGRPVLRISSRTSKNYANKVVQVGVESRMKEYGYSSALEVALDVAGRIRFIQEAC